MGRTRLIGLRSLLWLTAVLSCLSVGCQQDPAPETSIDEVPFAGVELTFAVPRSYGFTESLDPVVREWCAQTGAEIKVRSYDADLAGIDEIAAADVWLVPLGFVPELDSEGRIQAFAKDATAATSLEWSDVFEGIDVAVATRGRRPTVVPVSSPVLQCYYRADLLESAGREPPESWQEYLQLIQDRSLWAGDLPVLEPWHPEFLATLFQARSIAYAKHPENFSMLFDIASGEPRLDTPGFARSVEISAKIRAELPDSVLELTPADCLEKLVNGQAAMVLAVDCGRNEIGIPFGPVDAELRSAPIGRSGVGRIASLPLPGSREVFDLSSRAWRPPANGQLNRPALTSIGGVGLCLGATARDVDRQAAIQFIRRLGIEQVSAAFPDGTRTLTRESQFEAAIGWQSAGLTGAEVAENVRGIVSQLRARQVVADLPIVGRERYRNALSAGLVAWSRGELADDELLPKVQADWMQLTDDIGLEVVRDSYRRSVGLAALK